MEYPYDMMWYANKTKACLIIYDIPEKEKEKGNTNMSAL